VWLFSAIACTLATCASCRPDKVSDPTSTLQLPGGGTSYVT
jgi:hypothetical protein